MKFGRTPALHTARTMRSALALARYLDPLGAPPLASNDYVAAVDAATGGDWGMMANDQVGDCVWADTAHALMLRTANASRIVIPTAEEVLAAYSAHTGYNPADPSTDQGDNESEVCQYLETTGFLGHKSAGTAAVDPKNLDHVKWCVQLFGTCRLGVNWPQSGMDQFNAGQPLDVGGDDTVVGGHDVPIVKYDGSYVYLVTWGKLVPATPAWMLTYVEEAHAEVYPDWIRAQGTSPSGFSLDALVVDLKAI